MRAFCRHAQQRCAEHIRSGVGASDKSGAAGAQGAIGSLGAAQAEFDDGAVIGRFPYPGCFRGDQRLEINVAEQDRLDHLAFDKSAADLQERFIGENDSSFGNRSDVAAEPKILEILQECVAKQRGAGGRFHRAQEPDIVVAEFRVHDGPNGVLQALRRSA